MGSDRAAPVERHFPTVGTPSALSLKLRKAGAWQRPPSNRTKCPVSGQVLPRSRKPAYFPPGLDGPHGSRPRGGEQEQRSRLWRSQWPSTNTPVAPRGLHVKQECEGVANRGGDAWLERRKTLHSFGSIKMSTNSGKRTLVHWWQSPPATTLCHSWRSR